MKTGSIYSIEWLNPFRADFCARLLGYLALLFICLIALSQPCWSDATTPFNTQKNVSLVTSKFPPYMDPELADNGLLVAITRAAFNKVGYKLTLSYRPWADILLDLKPGQYDGILGVWFRPERQAWLAYSQPIGVNRIVLFKHTDFQFEFTGFDSLKPYTIGVVSGYASTPEFAAANLNLASVTGDEENVDKLVNRRVDFTLMDDMVMHKLMKKKYPHLNVLEEVGLVVESEDTFVGFYRSSPDFQQALTDFNRGLAKIRQDGTFVRIMNQYEGQGEH